MKTGQFNAIEVDEVYTHPAATTSEETILEIVTDIGPVQLHTIDFDASNLAMNATFRIYYKIDGVNYRKRCGTGPDGGTIVWIVGDGPWISFNVSGVKDHDIKVTVQSTLGELAPRDIPYSCNGAR